MLARSIASQRFEPIARETREVGQGQGCIEYFKSLPPLPIKALERPHELALREKLRSLSLKPKIIVTKFSCLDDVRQT